MKEKTKQNDFINILKGIGIIFVVIGHFNFDRNLNVIIYSFHMPLFFFISGYLFTLGKDWVVFLKKKIHSLLVPYFAYLIPISMLSYLSALDSGESWLTLLIRIVFGGRLLIEHCGVFWFVSCLFTTQLLARYIIVNNVSRLKAMLVLIFLGSVHSYYFSAFYLPWAVDIVPMACSIFLFGYYYRSKKYDFNISLLLLALICYSVIVIFSTSAEIDMKYANYGIPIVSLLGSLIMVLSCFKLSELIRKYGFLNNVFSYVGQCSLVIMYLHLPIKYTFEYVDLVDRKIVLVISIIVPCVFYKLCSTNKFTSFYFLGKSKAASLR